MSRRAGLAVTLEEIDFSCDMLLLKCIVGHDIVVVSGAPISGGGGGCRLGMVL